ncbi:MAG TPA: hypothetical protein VNN79_02880 [Actinomycetota bacterium]|nr:hypothetical protein [Actinomycetota bacterium]
MRYAFEFDAGAAGRAFLRAIGVRPDNAWVEVADGRLTAKFGHWVVRTPLSNVGEAHAAGPYREIRAIGLRLSLSDHGLTFGTNARRGVCIHFRKPLRTVTPLIPFRHPNLTVTVDRPEELATELTRASAARAV